VGDGPLRESLVLRAEELGIAERVTFLGWRQDMPQVYAALDLLTLTSRNEGTPVTIIEGMAAGVPVAATAVGGVPDLVRDRETGWLVPPDNSPALMGAWQAILKDPRGANEITRQAQTFVLKYYGQARMIAEMSDLYSKLARGRAHG
jgi:glycosyltransferase involved in cell wall biosynthesis